MSLRGGYLFFPTKQSLVLTRLLTALAYGAQLPWRAVPGSVGKELERLAATLFML